MTAGGAAEWMGKSAALVFVLAISVALVACGDSGPTEIREGSALKFEADPDGEFAYTTDDAIAEGGEVTIDFNNPQSREHIVQIDDLRGEVIVETPRVEADFISIPTKLKPGTYVFYCPVRGHRKAGMEGTLTIE